MFEFNDGCLPCKGNANYLIHKKDRPKNIWTGLVIVKTN